MEKTNIEKSLAKRSLIAGIIWAVTLVFEIAYTVVFFICSFNNFDLTEVVVSWWPKYVVAFLTVLTLLRSLKNFKKANKDLDYTDALFFEKKGNAFMYNLLKIFIGGLIGFSASFNVRDMNLYLTFLSLVIFAIVELPGYIFDLAFSKHFIANKEFIMNKVIFKRETIEDKTWKCPRCFTENSSTLIRCKSCKTYKS